MHTLVVGGARISVGHGQGIVVGMCLLVREWKFGASSNGIIVIFPPLASAVLC